MVRVSFVLVGLTWHNPALFSLGIIAFAFELLNGPSTTTVLGSEIKAMMPKLNNAGLCQVSPTNTNETLTKPEFGAVENYRPTGKVTYFRVSTTDDLQAPATADWVYNTLKLRRAYVLDDSESYGASIADGFEKRFNEIGGTVTGRYSVPRGTTNFHDILAEVAATSPDMLYYGGTSFNNIPLARLQMLSAGLNIPKISAELRQIAFAGAQVVYC